MESLLFIGSLFGLLPILALLALMIVVALRQDDDGGEERAPAIYGAIVAMLALLTLLFAVAGAASALADFTESSGEQSRQMIRMGDDDPSFGYGGRLGDSADHDDDWQRLVAAVIAGGVAVALVALHRPLLDRRRSATGAARRVYRAYLSVGALVTVLVAVLVGGFAVFAVAKVVAPGVFGNGDRGDAGRDAVPMLVLFLVSAGLWRWHWRELGVGGAASNDEVSAADAP